MSGLHADPQVATSFTIVAVGCLGRGGQHTDTPAPAPARASSPCDEETRPGLLSWETGCPQSLVQRAAAPLGPAGHARPLRACAHCTLLCQALQGETVSLHGTSVELQPSTAPAPAPGSGASPTAPSCSAAPAAAPEFAQQRSPRPAALPLPCPARPPGLSCPSSAATARGAPSQAPLRTCRVHVCQPRLLLAPRTLHRARCDPLGGTCPVPERAPGPGAPCKAGLCFSVACRLQLPRAQASATKPPSPVLRRRGLQGSWSLGTHGRERSTHSGLVLTPSSSPGFVRAKGDPRLEAVQGPVSGQPSHCGASSGLPGASTSAATHFRPTVLAPDTGAAR